MIINYLARKLTHEQFTRVILRPIDSIMIMTPGPSFKVYQTLDSDPIWISASPTTGPKVMRVFTSEGDFHLVNFAERPIQENFWVSDFDLRYRGILGTFFASIFIGGYYLIKNWKHKK